MVLQMRKELDAVFQRCKDTTLDERTTALVRFAAQLAAGNHDHARESYARASRGGAKAAPELARAACLAACSVGPKATAAFAQLSGKKALTAEKEIFSACTEKTLDPQTEHLVSLAVCLVDNCACSSGHIIRLRELKVDQASIDRAACIAAEEGGLRVKYHYLEHLQHVETCKSCVC